MLFHDRPLVPSQDFHEHICRYGNAALTFTSMGNPRDRRTESQRGPNTFHVHDERIYLQAAVAGWKRGKNHESKDGTIHTSVMGDAETIMRDSESVESVALWRR